MRTAEKITVIIAAGGTGTRFGGDVPKQFAVVDDMPVLWHTIVAFSRYSPGITIIVAMHKESITYWKKLTEKMEFVPGHIVVEGGKSRFHSVKNALTKCPDDGIILVHDAVRPFVSYDIIDRVVKQVHKNGAAIPVISVSDSIRRITKAGSESVDRKNYVRVQTPQGFKSAILKKAFEQRYSETFTDEASVVEKSGIKIVLVEGEESNIKITLKDDLP